MFNFPLFTVESPRNWAAEQRSPIITSTGNFCFCNCNSNCSSKSINPAAGYSNRYQNCLDTGSGETKKMSLIITLVQASALSQS